MQAISFTPEELAHVLSGYAADGFSVTYKPDAREQIARSWPESLDDDAARAEWGWAHR